MGCNLLQKSSRHRCTFYHLIVVLWVSIHLIYVFSAVGKMLHTWLEDKWNIWQRENDPLRKAKPPWVLKRFPQRCSLYSDSSSFNWSVSCHVSITLLVSATLHPTLLFPHIFRPSVLQHAAFCLTAPLTKPISHASDALLHETCGWISFPSGWYFDRSLELFRFGTVCSSETHAGLHRSHAFYALIHSSQF